MEFHSTHSGTYSRYEIPDFAQIRILNAEKELEQHFTPLVTFAKRKDETMIVISFISER